MGSGVIAWLMENPATRRLHGIIVGAQRRKMENIRMVDFWELGRKPVIIITMSRMIILSAISIMYRT